MGGRGGPLWQRITYQMSPSTSVAVPAASPTTVHHGAVRTEDADGTRREEAVPSFFCWLEQRLAQLRLSQQGSAAAKLPFDFWGGFVGYLGYELKQECGFANGHDAATPDAAMFLADRRATPSANHSAVLRASLLSILMSVPSPVGPLCRVIAVDHRTEDVYLLAMHDPSDAGQ